IRVRADPGNVASGSYHWCVVPGDVDPAQAARPLVQIGARNADRFRGLRPVIPGLRIIDITDYAAANLHHQSRTPDSRIIQTQALGFRWSEAFEAPGVRTAVDAVIGAVQPRIRYISFLDTVPA